MSESVEPAVTSHNVLRGPWPERGRFLDRLNQMAADQQVPLLTIRKQLAAKIGDSEDGNTVYRLINGDPRSKRLGYTLQPSPRVARALAVAMGLGVDELVSSAPPDTHKKAKKAPEDAPPTQPSLHLEDEEDVPGPGPFVSAGTRVLTNEPPPAEDVPPVVVRAAYHYLPLDLCGKWGQAIVQAADGWWKAQLVANKIPSLVQFLDNGLCTVQALTSFGYAATSNPTALINLPLEEHPEVPVVQVISDLTGLFAAYGVASFEAGEKSVAKRAIAKGAVQDPLATLRAASLTALDAIQEVCWTIQRDVENLEADIAGLLGAESTLDLTALALVDDIKAMRLNLRAILLKLK